MEVMLKNGVIKILLFDKDEEFLKAFISSFMLFYDGFEFEICTSKKNKKSEEMLIDFEKELIISGKKTATIKKYSGVKKIYAEIYNLLLPNQSPIFDYLSTLENTEIMDFVNENDSIEKCKELSLFEGKNVFYLPIMEKCPEEIITKERGDFVFEFFYDKKKAFENIMRYIEEDASGFYYFCSSEKNYFSEFKEEELLEIIAKIVDVLDIDIVVRDFGERVLAYETRMRFGKERNGRQKN
jgi:hypothetical protein